MPVFVEVLIIIIIIIIMIIPLIIIMLEILLNREKKFVFPSLPATSCTSSPCRCSWRC